MTQIFIEGNELDLTQELSHQLTFAIDDLTNLDSKATSFSKTIVIPGTTRNNNLLGNIFEFGASNEHNINAPNVYYNFNASRSAKALISINGLQALKGVMRLLSIIVDEGRIEYEVALFGELGGFISKITNKRLTDIDFNDLNHDYTLNNIIGSWQNRLSFTITTSTTFNSSLKRIRITNRLLGLLRKGDQIQISGTASNNGIFTITNIELNPLLFNQRTDIYVAETIVTETDSSFAIELVGGGYGKGYTYPLIDYGLVTYNIPTNSPTFTKHHDYQFRAFRPAIYVKEYIERILQNAGYTYSSIFFNTPFFKRLIIPHNGIALEKVGITNYVDANTTKTYSGTNITSSLFQTIVWDNVPTLNTFSVDGASQKFTFTGSSDRTIKASAKISGTFSIKGAFNPPAKMILQKSDGTVISFFDFEQTNNQTRAFDILLEGVTNISPGQSIQVTLFVVAADYLNLYTATYNFTFDAELDIIQDPPSFILYEYTDNIKMNDVVPRNILQKDFFTSILKMFNLMVVEDKQREKHLIIEPYVDFFKLNRNSYIDWTDKVNRAKPITIKPMSEANARFYEFKYKPDNDFFNEEYKKKYNETYGDRIYDNQLEFAKDRQSLEIIFSPSVLVGYDNEEKVVTTIYKKNNDIEEPIAHNIRILQIRLIKDVLKWHILNNDGILSAPSEYLYAGHFNNPTFPTADINFGVTRELRYALSQGSLQNNLFNSFYYPYMAEITDKDSRLVTCEMKLNEIDIFNLDFRRFVYVDGVLYRIEKIIDWSENNVCKAELLRVINTTYQSQLQYYEDITIGSQVWVKNNLFKYTYNNGEEIPIALDDHQWKYYADNKIGCCARFKYIESDEKLAENGYTEYGLYYNHWAVNDARGLAPNGYRVATLSDYETLKTTISNNGNKVKEDGTLHWSFPNTGTNETDFSAYGGGYIDDNGNILGVGTSGFYWTGTIYPSNINKAHLLYLENTTNTYLLDFDSRGIGMHVRLIKT